MKKKRRITCAAGTRTVRSAPSEQNVSVAANSGTENGKRPLFGKSRQSTAAPMATPTTANVALLARRPAAKANRITRSSANASGLAANASAAQTVNPTGRNGRRATSASNAHANPSAYGYAPVIVDSAATNAKTTPGQFPTVGHSRATSAANAAAATAAVRTESSLIPSTAARG